MKQTILLFDGDCNFCNKWVQFILERSENIYFASLKSSIANKLLSEYNYQNEIINTLVLFHNNKIYTKSAAVLQVVKLLNGFWPLFNILSIVPLFIRDKVYEIFANNRYKWFGKNTNCIINERLLKENILE